MSPSQRPTVRELEVLTHVLRSCNKQAALELGLSPQTVKNHLSKLYRKLEVHSNTEAAVQLGWFMVPKYYATALIRSYDDGRDSRAR